MQFKGPMTRSKTKSVEEHISLKLMMLHEAWNSNDMKIMDWSTIIE